MPGRLIAALGTALLVTLVAGGAAGAAGPEYRLGFRALADLAPDVVGQPLEDEHSTAEGDSLQRTTRGLMVWRKATNTAAFTDGHLTWIDGPHGLQIRTNQERFGWELAPLGPGEGEPIQDHDRDQVRERDQDRARDQEQTQLCQEPVQTQARQQDQTGQQQGTQGGEPTQIQRRAGQDGR